MEPCRGGPLQHPCWCLIPHRQNCCRSRWEGCLGELAAELGGLITIEAGSETAEGCIAKVADGKGQLGREIEDGYIKGQWFGLAIPEFRSIGAGEGPARRCSCDLAVEVEAVVPDSEGFDVADIPLGLQGRIDG